MFSFINETDISDIDYSFLNSLPDKAIILLKSKKQNNIKKAKEILNHLLDKQITAIDSEYYGLWLQEETDSKKGSKIYDKNATTYIGIPLFILLKEYSDELSEDLIKKIEYALSLACIYIINRNIHMQHSHIVIAESFLTAACGELLKSIEFKNYAVNLLEHFYHYNIAHGSFTEFNTTIFDKNSLFVLHLAKKYITNNQFLQLSDLISDSLWKITAQHYHYQTGNIAGPCQRCDNIFISKEIESFLTDSCTSTGIKDNNLTFYNICPSKYRAHFDGRKQNWYSQEIVSQGSSFPYYLYSIVATTLMKPDYCIGSFNRGECWKYSASFLGYFGTRKSPFAFKVTTLHDNHEYSSAQLSMIQHMNYVLGHISFATNRGDKHITIDTINGSIRAKDLRIRFYIIGDVSKLNVEQVQNTVNVKYKNIKIKFAYSCVKFDNYKPEVKLTRDKELYFDLILYTGKQKKINFTEIKKAIISWTFCISDNEIPNFSINNEFKKNYLVTKACTDDSTELTLESYYKPDTHENIHVNNKQYIHGTLLEKYTMYNSNMNKQYSYIINSNQKPGFNLTLTDSNNIESLIYALKESDEESIIQSVKNIFSLIYKTNVTIMLVKRFAIQIISHILEFYRNTNPRFETVAYDASQIYPIQIISATDTETVAYHVFALLNIMHSTYLSFAKSEENQKVINQITTLINNEYSNPNLSLEYISNQCGISSYNISRYFKTVYNLKYIDYLTNIRINHSKEYLKNPQYTLEEITSKIGYTNISTFMRAFKKITGETPNQYRKNLGI